MTAVAAIRGQVEGASGVCGKGRAWAAACAAGLAVALAARPAARAAEGEPAALAASDSPGAKAAGGLVVVDVVVSNGRGEPVMGLDADAFRVMEDGQPQRVASFEAIDLRARPGDETSSGPRAAESPAPRVSSNSGKGGPAQGRTFLLVFDDVHLGAGGAADARRAALRFLEVGPQAGDTVILVVPGAGLLWNARMPEGGAQLRKILASLRGRRTHMSFVMSDHEAMRIIVDADRATLELVCARLQAEGSFPTDAELTGVRRPNNELLAEIRKDQVVQIHAEAQRILETARARKDHVLGALASALDGLGGDPGRKAVVLFSEGFVHEQAEPLMDEVFSAARRTNAALYFFDVRGLLSGGSLEDLGAALPSYSHSRVDDESAGALTLAQQTGGFAAKNANEFSAAFARLSRDCSHYYLISYRSANTRQDGGLRTIGVEVQRPGVTVRARAGYYAAPDRGARLARPDAGIDSRLEGALDSPHEVADIPVRLTEFALEPVAGGKVEMTLAAEIGGMGLRFATAPDGSRSAVLDVLLAIRPLETGAGPGVASRQWNVRLPPEVSPETAWLPWRRSLPLPAGIYQAKLVVHDRGSGAIGSVIHPFEVPKQGTWRVSSPILSDVLDGAGARRPGPGARRSFAVGELLFCYFEVYGLDAGGRRGEPRLSHGYSLLDGRGRVLRKETPAPLAPGEDGRLARLIEIPLARIEPGDYELVLSFRDEAAGGGVELREPFSVSRPARANAGLYEEALRTYLDGDGVRAIATVLPWAPERVAELAVGLPVAQDSLRRAALMLHTDLALLLFRHGNHAAAEAHVAIGRSLLRREAPSARHRDWLLALASLQQADARMAEALAFYAECIDQYPGVAQAWLGAGTIYDQTAYPDGFGGTTVAVSHDKAVEEAERRYREALRLDPALDEARLRLGWLLKRSGRPDEAQAELKQVAAAKGEGYLTALAHLFLGQMLEERGRPADASRHYEAALEADLDCQAAALALARVLQAEGRRGAAAAILVPALGSPQGSALRGGAQPWLEYHRGLARRSREALAALRRDLAVSRAEAAE